jgi:cyclophilin family peptidyl-prolyl cis-trans isomerase
MQRHYASAADDDARRELCRARVPGTSSAGHSALHWAAAGGHAAAVGWLLGLQEVEVNAQNNGCSVPLHSACANGHAAIVRLLCAAGGDASINDTNAQSPFDVAAARGHEAAAAALPASIRGRVPHTYLRLSVAGAPVGDLIFALDEHKAPRACANFLALAEGIGGRGYRGGRFHRLLPGQVLQGGKLGVASASVFGGSFKDEPAGLARRHDRRGLLCCANAGPNSNGSQFYITLAPAAHLDGRHVVFGRLVGSDDALRVAEAVPVSQDTSQPMYPIVITHCGRWPPPEDKARSAAASDLAPGLTVGELASASDRTRDGVQSAVADGLRNSMKRGRDGADSESRQGASVASEKVSPQGEERGAQRQASLARWDVLSGLGESEEGSEEEEEEP